MSDKDEPWTADDIRKNAPNWSLHCDGKLLEYMKNLSKTIEERGNRTTYNLHSSLLELDRTKIVLENATNNLMALQHKQFVENRVYDDDETIANIDNVPVTDTDQTDKPTVSAIDALRNAIDVGMKLMDQHYDKVTYELSDSEDDGAEVEKSVIFRPKNPYKHRPLPYIIGSKEWHEKWHIGLVEEDSDQSDNDNNEDEEEDHCDTTTQIRSSPAISVSSNVPVSLSESENPRDVSPSRKSNAQDLFRSSSEENLSKLPHEIADSDSTFQRQNRDTKNIAPNTKRLNNSTESNSNNSIFMPQKSQISHAIPTLIDSDPPELDDVPSSSRVAHKPPNLFLDDDDDDNKRDDFLPSTSKGAANTRPSQQKSEPIRNLFDNDNNDTDDDELFLPSIEPTTTANPIPNQRSTILSTAPKKDVYQYNLFDDNPPEDDFESVPSKLGRGSVTNITSKKPTNLFSTNVNLFAEDDDDDDIFEKLITPSSGSKKQPIKADNDKNETDFETGTSEQNDEITKNFESLSTTMQSNNKSNLFKPGGLFDDTPPSDDEQLFSGISKKDDTTNKQKAIDVGQKTTKEFYNDFSETITASSHTDKMTATAQPMERTKTAQVSERSVPELKSSSKAESIGDQSIEDEPKSTTKPLQKKVDGSSRETRSEFMKKIDSFSHVNVNVNEAKSEIDVPPVPKARQPKKLNIGSIDINVTALLPGAKRTRLVEKSDNKDISDDISNDTLATSQIMSTAKTISQDNVDSSGRLVNLNRNRVKNLSRRPSTRAGRKQRYQLSMDSEEHIDEGKKIIIEDEDAMETNVSLQTHTEVANTISHLVRNDNEQRASGADEENNPFSFLDDNENGENEEFLYTEPENPKPLYTSASVKATPAYIDELPPELEDPAEDKFYDGKNVKGTSLLSQNALSLFEDEDDDFDNIERTEIPPDIPSDTNKSEDDWSPISTVGNTKMSPACVGKQHQVSSAVRLFEDDGDVDNGLFGPKNTTATGSNTSYSKSIGSLSTSSAVKNHLNTGNFNEYDNENAEKVFDAKVPNVKELEQKSTPTAKNDKKLPTPSVLGLFDDDPDDADLFGSKLMAKPSNSSKDQKEKENSPKPTSTVVVTIKQSQPKRVHQKIFSDDSSDDDLFGGGKKMVSNIPSKSTSNRSNTSIIPEVMKKTKVNDNLFNDSEDDDLFGGSKPKPTGIQIKNVKSLSPSSVDNDPLADLLK